MPIDILISTGSLTGFPLSRTFDLARRAGADGVELMLTGRLARGGPTQIRALERRFGIPVRSVHTVMRLREPSPHQAADDIVTSARFTRCLPACEVLVVHVPNTPSPHTTGARLWFDAIETARTITEPGRTRIAIENTGSLKRSDPAAFLDDPDRLHGLAEEWGLAITYDTSHAASRAWDVVACAAHLAPHIANVHLSDYGCRTFPVGLANALLRDHQMPGAGTLPLHDVLAALAETGYTGLVTLELSPVALRVPWRPAAERRLRAAVAGVRASITGSGHTHRHTRHPGRA